MEKDFDLKRVGRRMPYTVPENFFDDMEKNILSETGLTSTATPKRRRAPMRIVAMGIASIAAAAALLFVFTHSNGNGAGETGSFAEVEQAFAQLSVTDQDYLIEVYQDDIFIDEQQFNY